MHSSIRTCSQVAIVQRLDTEQNCGNARPKLYSRARVHQPGFDLRAGEEHEVARICMCEKEYNERYGDLTRALSVDPITTERGEEGSETEKE